MTDRLPRICFVAPNALPILAPELGVPFVGGAELQQVLIAKGLVARGYPVSMICLDFGQPDCRDFAGITVHRAHRPKPGLPGLRFVWPKLTSIWSSLTRADADIYYQRTASMLTGVVSVFAKRSRKRFVFAMAGETKIRFARDRWLYRHGVVRADSIVVQNSHQAQLVREQFGREGVLIPNICRVPGSGAVASPRFILWAGMIRSVKRPDIFLDLARLMPDLTFVMVGGRSEGEGSLYESVSARATSIPNLDFVGFVPSSEMDEYFDHAMMLVNTSVSEGFPNTFLQSWIRGIPTVSFVDTGARAEGRPVGIVVATPAEMQASVARLAGNAAERASSGEAAKRYVELHHSPERVLDRYEELFRGLLT